METARGRWFLKEYARRMRAAETAGLLGALQRIEAMVAATGSGAVLSAPPGSNLPADAVVRIEKISERLLDVSWYMRERGFDHSACSAIDSEARQLAALVMASEDEEPIDSGCAAPDQACSETEASIIIEAHVNADATPSMAPTPVAPPPAAAPVEASVPAERPALAGRAAAFIHVDRMPVRQRLALFA